MISMLRAMRYNGNGVFVMCWLLKSLHASLVGSWILDGWYYVGCIFLQPFFTTRTTKSGKSVVNGSAIDAITYKANRPLH